MGGCIIHQSNFIIIMGKIMILICMPFQSRSHCNNVVEKYITMSVIHLSLLPEYSQHSSLIYLTSSRFDDKPLINSNDTFKQNVLISLSLTETQTKNLCICLMRCDLFCLMLRNPFVLLQLFFENNITVPDNFQHSPSVYMDLN